MVEKEINRDYIGIVKQLPNKEFAYDEFIIDELEKEENVLEKLNEFYNVDTADYLELVKLFIENYPQDISIKHVNYILPHKYSSSYVTGCSYPTIYSKEEYGKKIKEYERELREKKIESDSAKRELEKIKVILGSEAYSRHIADIENKISEEVESLKKTFAGNFYSTALRFIPAYHYAKTIDKISEDKSIKMVSTCQIGWRCIKFDLNDKISFVINSNFGYGLSSYFHCNLQYMGINILPFSEIIKYYFVRWISLLRFTRSFAVCGNSWKDVFEFVTKTANMAVMDKDNFEEKWIISEVREMVSGLKDIMKTPRIILEKMLSFNGEIELGKRIIFQNCSSLTKEEYALYPNEKVLAFKVEKITGCLNLLDNLRSLDSVGVKVKCFIDDIIGFNKELQPEIICNISKIGSELDIKKKKLEDIKTELEKKEEYERITYSDKLNKIIEEEEKKRSYTIVKVQENAEKILEKEDKTFAQLMKEKREIIENKEEIEKDIRLRNKFLEILERGNTRIREILKIA